MPTKFAMRLLAGTAVSALLTGVSFAAEAEARPFDIPQQDAATALQAFAMQSGRQVLFPYEAAKGKTAPEVKGDYSDEEVITLLAASAGLKVTADDGRTVTLRPQFAQSAEAGGGGEVDTLVVTAQKREEDIQDVPIAISAFTQEDLTRSQVAGGPDLMTQVPNMTFTKTNFTSYSIQIRGIGTQAISATTDAAVAVAFNNTPFIRNRFFEQEFYDLQRVEVLRGPQGTLYGRNATAGVVNIISQKPRFNFEAKASGDVANYGSTRLEGMINIPLVEDVVALRLAGAWTKREGFVTNENTGEPTDGRDLWSSRLSLRVAPTEGIDANLIWEHFEEDDDRLRSGKQLCHTDEVTEVAGMPTTHFQTLLLSGQGEVLFAGVQGTFSQGCKAASLYAPESFQVPSGLALPYYGPLAFVGLPVALDDPYLSRTQSRDLRVIQSSSEPAYRAKSDLMELQVSVDITPELTLASETAYAVDEVFSTQDFNRFNTAPGAWAGDQSDFDSGLLTAGPNGPVYCDPQVGCSDRLAAADLSTAESTHFSQELRLSSDFDAPFNFSIGANFLRYDTEDKYYVFINSLNLSQGIMIGQDNSQCLRRGEDPGDTTRAYQLSGCLYWDTNPIERVNDKGHNYFLSRNPFKLISYAVFGETYYQLAENLKITGGLRWTVDRKQAPRVPSWLLAPESVGYPVAEVVNQEWREPTGRLAIDWQPDLSFTDQTLVYGSYARGYKAGGANPPTYIPVYFAFDMRKAGLSRLESSATRPKTFEAEYIDAFELGAKNTLLDGSVTLNLAAFYYDYRGYQISEIVDRSAFNRNFDAEVWGLEIEADWRPSENLRFGFKGGYENTRIADGERAIDLMDRTAGRTDWVTVSPFPTFPSNCILPAWLFRGVDPGTGEDVLLNLGSPAGGGNGGCELAYVLGVDPVTHLDYVPNPTEAVSAYQPGLDYRPGYPGWNPLDASQGHNNGEGFFKDLSGNELPNAPNFTATLTADYTVALPNDWLATLHTDLYYQSEAWIRVFNTEGYDKLKAYTNVNLAAIFTNEDAGWNVMAYVKNVFDRDSITGAFLNSDDTGLTTNVFLTEPRLYGLRVTKSWTGGPLLGGFGQRREGPYALTVELGGQAQRHDAPYTAVADHFLDVLPADLDPRTIQNRDLDRGDGREVKLTYRPASSGWFASLGARFGKTNGADRARQEAPVAAPRECGVPDIFVERFCDPDSDYYLPVAVADNAKNWTDAETFNKVEHSVVDFSVGAEVGLGALGLSESTIAAGVRYAQLESLTRMSSDSVPNWDLANYWALSGKYATHGRYTTAQVANREFKGVGPTLTWDAATRLLGTGERGHVNLDWTVTGGLLFGRQKASIIGQEQVGYWIGEYGGDGIRDMTPDSVETTQVAIRRSKRVSVPVLDLSLGLSYSIDRVRVGAGYRWERYFDAIDGGDIRRERYDRTIDGPYFKLSVGFGG